VTIDEAIRDLLNVSTDIQGVAVLGAEGDVVAAGPGAVAADLAVMAGLLWETAVERARVPGQEGALDHVVVHDAQGVVAMLAACGRRIAAVTGPRPAVGLLLFDLRTCLGDAFAEEEGQ
jgi:predicted regulator of Ras-like GTPase activity (Roadblock/LC7/MglB family)